MNGLSQKVHYNPLESMVVFSLGGTTLWSGRGRLRAEDLGLGEDDAPPEAIASLGSKKLFPPDKLKLLQKKKRLMHRDCGEVGMRFVGGYAVPEHKAEALATRLDARVKEGQDLADDILRNFDSTVAAWHRENPAWAHILRAGTPEKEAVAKKIRFDYEAYLVSKPKNSVVGARFSGAVSALGDSLYQEVAAEAAAFVKKSLLPGREAKGGTQKTAAPVRRMVDKLRGLEFLDPRIKPLNDVLMRILSRVPVSGCVKDDAFLAIVGCASALADASVMQDIGQRAADGENVDDLADELMGRAKPAANEAPAKPSKSVDRKAAGGSYLDRIGARQVAAQTLGANELFSESEPADDEAAIPVATIRPPATSRREAVQAPRHAVARRPFTPLSF